jgi:uncharacterized membrane protein
MKSFSKIFFTGLAALLPALLTAYILIWLGSKAESLFGGAIKLILPDRYYAPGMGLLVGAALIFLVGLMLRAWIVRYVFLRTERLLNRIPLVKAIYSSIRDLMGFFAGGKDQGFSQVVLVRVGDTDIRLLGFVTREDFSDLPAGMAPPGSVAVYMPMSYQIGGYTAILPRSAVEPVDMSMQEAMRFAITGGMKSKRVGAARGAATRSD